MQDKEPAPLLFAGSGEMRARCRALDWSATWLGAVELWPAPLRTAAAVVLGSGFPMILVWGPQLVQIYNDAYAPLIGRKHPRALGLPTHTSWPEIRRVQEAVFARVFAGETVTVTDALYHLDRYGALEDAYFDASFSPVPLEDGSVGGSLSVLFETTARVAARAADAERARLARELEAERARLRTVFSQAPAAVAVTAGPDHRFVLANPRAEQAAGGRELVGRTYREAFPELEAQGFVKLLDDVYVSGDPFVAREMRLLLARDGGTTEEGWYDFVYQPLRDMDGRITGILQHAVEVTEQVRARQTLAENEGQFRTLADAIPTLAWTAKPDGYVDWYNARWYEYTGTTPDQMEGWNWQSVHDPAALPEVLAGWRASIASGKPFEMTFPLRGASGCFRLFLTRVTPGCDAQGRVVRWFGTATDVETERAARSEAERAQAEAEAANRAKGEFLAMMSHELRTPLNAIGGYAELIELGLHGPVTEQQRSDLSRIRQSQKHLLGLINQVLNYTRVETGTVRYDLADLPVGEALAAAEALIVPQVRGRGLTYVLGGCDPALRVRADRDKVQQILLNLLTNATKFTDPGGEIRVSCVTRERAVAILVADTGVGIAADKLGAVFEPFVQVDQRLTRPHEGVGLGLAISRELARGMGGDLTVQSTPGVGSTFTLTLPGA